MAKKLSDIREFIESNKLSFCDYLVQNEDADVINILHDLSLETRIFIFSGIIRNYFLGIKNNRDIDIILEGEIDVYSFFKGFEIKQNSFGGFKININNTVIDLWYLKDTWALKKNPVLDFGLEKQIPYTAFFNFSAIVYSFNDKEFYYTKDFLRFLRDKQIDVVHKPNANYHLCVVNTIYYSDKYQLKVSDNLKRYTIKLFDKLHKNYEQVQIKHFGNILYSNSEIEARIKTYVDDPLPHKAIKKLSEIESLNTKLKLAKTLFNYQEDLTTELDKYNIDFTEQHILKIILWKLNRYPLITSDHTRMLNDLKNNYNDEKAKNSIMRLLKVKGLDLPMVSTILRFLLPDKFQIIDQRSYRILYGKELKFSTSKEKKTQQYLDYLKELHLQCELYQINFCEADRVLYSLDKIANATINLKRYG